MAKQKGGVKLRRSKNRKTKYAAQYIRTKRNKIARLKKRLPFDKTAGPALKKLMGTTTQPTIKLSGNMLEIPIEPQESQ